MSSPGVHIIQGLVSSALLYPVIGEKTIPFGLAVILIDIDHVIEYVVDTKDCNPKGLFVYRDIILQNLDKDFLGFNVFHTIECYLLVLLLAHWFSVLYYVLGGFLFHHTVDQIALIRMRKPFARALSILEYSIKRKKYITSIKELFQQENLKVDGIPNLHEWLMRWGIKPQKSIPEPVRNRFQG